VQIDKPGYGFRLGTEGGASLHEVEAEPPVVEAACNTLDPKSGFAWRICTMGGRPSLVNSVQDKASFRHSVGRMHPARLQISGCSEGGFNGGNRTSYPLVHNFKGRTHWHETQVNFRLQGNKSVFGDPKICLRQYPKYSPLFAKGPMGRKDRLKGCLFSPGGTPKTKTIFENASWRKNLGVSGWMFWPKYYATTFHTVDENISDQVEEKWHPGFCVLGRHFGPRNIQKSFGKSFGDSDTGFGVSRIQNKPEKECPTTMPRGNSFGFQPQPERGLFTAKPLKVKNCQERTWKNCSSQENVNQENGSHFGQGQELFSCPPFFKSFHRSTVQVCAARGTGRLELSPPHPPLLKDQLKEVKHLLTSWEGRLFTTNHTRELFSDSSDLAWGAGQRQWRNNPRLLEKQKFIAYQCKGANSCSQYNHVLSKAWGDSVVVSRQHDKLLVPDQGGWEESSPQPVGKALFQMVHEEQSHLEGKLGAIRTYVGRQHFKVGGGQEEYSLNPQIFQALLRKYKGWLEPKTDMLASPNSHQLQNFVSRWPHWQATAVDALKCPLEGLGDMYALPPWKIISQWLQRLKLEKGAKCLMVVPYWVGAIWWPQLIKLRIPKSPVFMVKPDWGVFSNVLGEAMPPQRYPLISILCSGHCFSNKASRPKPSVLIWQTTHP